MTGRRVWRATSDMTLICRRPSSWWCSQPCSSVSRRERSPARVQKCVESSMSSRGRPQAEYQALKNASRLPATPASSLPAEDGERCTTAFRNGVCSAQSCVRYTPGRLSRRWQARAKTAAASSPKADVSEARSPLSAARWRSTR